LVDWVQDGLEAWNYLEHKWTHYQVGIFKLTGIELCRRLRQKLSPLPILILTARDGIEDKVQGTDAGADDYLIKPFSTPDLLERVRALARRSPQFQTQKLQIVNITLDYSTLSISIKETVVRLTAKEFQILETSCNIPLTRFSPAKKSSNKSGKSSQNHPVMS
jgi:DNA-binding response OmpR family regulator